MTSITTTSIREDLDKNYSSCNTAIKKAESRTVFLVVTQQESRWHVSLVVNEVDCLCLTLIGWGVNVLLNVDKGSCNATLVEHTEE